MYLWAEKLALSPSSSVKAGWTNEDMNPVPPEQRTWTTRNYVAYWVSASTNVAVWQFASSMLALGLSWRQAFVAIVLGHSLISLVMALNGTVGARYRVPFPVLIRTSFGFWFSYFTIVTRAIIGLFWFGIFTQTGGNCVYQMLKAIWPSTAHIPNSLPDNSATTTVGMMTYLIFWLVQLPLMLVSPQRIRHFFTFKAIVVPLSWLAILIWAMVRAPPSVSLAPKHATASGSTFSWAFLHALNSALGGYATLAVNIPDFTRYAKTERDQLVQPIIIPLAFTFMAFVGIAVTSAGEVLYGETLWNPLNLIDRWDNRAAAFFAALSFFIATIGTNIATNSLSAANDLTVLFPRYINIRRGQVSVALLGGWALCPWEILASAPKFLSFVSGYSIFFAPFAGIMVTDFWIVQHRILHVADMYDPHGRYRYWNGINWRAAVSLLCTIPPCIPGLIHNIRPSIRVGNASHLYDIGFFYGFFIGGGVYWACNVLWPVPTHEHNRSDLVEDSDSVSELGRETASNTDEDDARKV
ncbi:cytosine-purine permease [Cylindrobasidium torrendii FP15055 ss-10]|uniref:Cytosine-purine permease n=1 Tax=Cylindrobasidium torrendii FP15055 ss-10 TaxID=1314674 RepID=A0A0D7BR71_9AGAR|nr:cytosine-purine permease [Cylindrobasidium torrendii FP15055 ss-10]